MPNWCYTDITFTGEKNHVDKLNNIIDNSIKKNWRENGFGKEWLGNVVIGSGLCTVEEFDDQGHYTPRCRGRIDYIDRVSDEILNVTTETAYEPMLKMWILILDKYKLDIEITYVADDLTTNDPMYDGNYYIDCEFYGKDEKILYDIFNLYLGELLITQLELDEIIKDVDNLGAYGCVDTLEKLENIEFRDDRSFLMINKYQYCDVYDLQ